jgi:tetratricopeptide (TPR) repeat protein/preprotein translocase subunit SecG
MFFLALLGVVLYRPSMQAPWYLDDFHNIVDNPFIRDIAEAFSSLFVSRGIAFASFALNYKMGGLEVTGFHLVNLLIHILTAIVVLLILQHLYGIGSWQSFFGSALFLCHPIQTQAVTYIVQRMTSLAAFFFFLSIFAYIKFRKEMEKNGDVFSFAACQLFAWALLCGALAVLTKENTAVLPLVLLLLERTVISRQNLKLRQVLRYLLPFMLVTSGVLLQQFVVANSTLTQVNTGVLHFLQTTDPAGSVLVTKEPGNLVLRYLFTQFVVVWIYAGKLIIPIGQTLDYSYPLVARLLNFKSVAGLLAIGTLLVFAFRQLQTSPLLALGIFWFFVTLSIESTFIPLDTMFEHRLYIPLFGFIIFLNEALDGLRPQIFRKSLLISILVIMSVLTWNRNQLWANPIAFWQDNVNKAPHSFRPKVSLAREIIASENPDILDQAFPALKEAIALYPQGEVAWRDLGHYYVKKKDFKNARAAFEKAFALNNQNLRNMTNLAAVSLDLGDLQGAAFWSRRILAIEPSHSIALYIFRETQR